MLREGSLRQDLAATLPALIASGVNLQRMILVTDSMTPDDVEERGHMDNVVRRAMLLGLTPLQAIQSVTLNAATYSGLEQEVGGIAPGRFADIGLIDDLEQCHVREVVIGGKVVARRGVSECTANDALPHESDAFTARRRDNFGEYVQNSCARVQCRRFGLWSS